MDVNIKQFKCGQCGEEKHTLYLKPNGDIITECVECKSKSILTVTKPEIKILFHEESTGRITIF